MAALSIQATISKVASKTTAAATTSTAAVQPVKFHRWTGWIPAIRTIVDRQMRSGGEAHYAQGNGQNAPDATAVGWRFEATQAAALTFASQAESLPSPSPYTVVDAWSRTMRIRIVAVVCEVTKVKGPVNGTAQTTHMIRCSLTVERLPNAPQP